MDTVDIRFEDVSGRESLLVTANLADGWKQLRSSFGFYGFARREYQQDNRVTVRVWVVERSADLHPTANGFPLDLQSMGSSPSKAVAFRLFHGRLSLGALMSTVASSSRNGGKPGFYEDAILIARHEDVAYWLRFYAALNEEHFEPPEWLEHDLWAKGGALPGPEQIPAAPTFEIEERLTRLSSAVDALEGRVGALGEDLQGRVATSLRELEGKSAGRAEDLEKVARELEARWSQQFQQRAEAVLERLRDELKDSAIEEGRRQLVSLAGGSEQFQIRAQAAVERLREELTGLGQAIEKGKRQLAELAEAKLASLRDAVRDESGQDRAQAIREHARAAQAAADAGVKSIRQVVEEALAQLQGKLQEEAEAAVGRLREEAQKSGQVIEEGKRQLASLAEAKVAALSQATGDATGQQTEQAQTAADVGVKSIRQGVEEALAQLQGKLQEEAGAAVGRLREEAQSSGQAIEEGKRQLAILAEAKVAALSQASRDATGQQTEQARAAADAGVKSIRQAVEEALAQLQGKLQEEAGAAVGRLREEAQSSGQAIEEGKRQLAILAEAKVAALSQATRDATGQQTEQARAAADAGVKSIRQAVEEAVAQLQGKLQEAQAAADAGVKSIWQVVEEALAQLQGKLQEEAEAAAAKLREEAQSSGQVIEEGKRQLAILAEAKLGTLSHAARDGSGQQMQQASPAQAQVGEAAVDAEVKSIQQATEAAMAHLQAEFDKQTAAAVEKLREEARNSGRVIEEGKRQMANLAEIKLGSLGQVTAKAAAGFEAEQRKLKNQYETARKELETLLARRVAALNLKPSGPERHGTVAKLLLAVGLFLAITVPPICVYLSTPPPPQLRLQAERPPDYVDQNPNWNSKRRDREEEVAQAYWRVAVANLQGKYPFGSELPAYPPPEFQVDNMYDPPGGAKALTETRNYYWERLRSCWLQREYWVETPAGNVNWATRFRELWEQIKAKLT
jgi:uncharacterized protein YjbJ (UPF0337 family)